jgi:hypothetical protein
MPNTQMLATVGATAAPRLKGQREEMVSYKASES